MSNSVVTVDKLFRSYDKIQAVQGLSFSMEAGSVLGFIGANGAGKTTTLRIMASLDEPNAGTVEVCGNDVVHFPHEVRRRIGWMPDAFDTYSHITVVEYLDFFSRAFGYSGKMRHARLEEVIEFTDLGSLATRETSALSKGMRQRLCLARMLLHDPEVLIMDEPAAGLDPRARVEFKHLVRLLAEEGKSVIISSHILSELEDMCDDLLFIDAGKEIYHGSVDGIKKQQSAGAVFAVRVIGAVDDFLQWIELNPGIDCLESLRDGAKVSLESTEPEDIARMLKRILDQGIQVVEFRKDEHRLEDAFISLLSKLDEEKNGNPNVAQKKETDQ